MLTASDGKKRLADASVWILRCCRSVTTTIEIISNIVASPSSVATRHLQDVAFASWCDRGPDLLA
ncbi:MAG TPA: hypothetical protein VF424_08205, partial [Vicinamibacterales bacterium]